MRNRLWFWTLQSICRYSISGVSIHQSEFPQDLYLRNLTNLLTVTDNKAFEIWFWILDTGRDVLSSCFLRIQGQHSAWKFQNYVLYTIQAKCRFRKRFKTANCTVSVPRYVQFYALMLYDLKFPPWVRMFMAKWLLMTINCIIPECVTICWTHFSYLWSVFYVI